MSEGVKRIQLGVGVEIEVPESYKALEEKCRARIEEILAKYPKAKKMYELIINDPEVNACWDMADYIAVKKLRYNDHGETHAIIVAAFALEMLELLHEAGCEPDIVADGFGDMDDAALIVLSAALLHDIGNQVHREGHSLFSAVLAAPILARLLPKIYEHPEIAAEIRGFILHAIHSHEKEIPSLTVEASIICIADGCDMFKGRGRLPFDLGNVNIHTVSALSISNVRVEKGARRPVRITVEMENSAGIFQVQELLKEKVDSGVLEDKIEIVAMATPPESSTDHRIVSRLIYEGGRFIPF